MLAHTSLLLLASALLVGFSVLLLSASIIAARSRGHIRTRFERYLATGEGTPVTTLELELAEPFSKRVVLPILRRLLGVLAWMWPKNRLDMLRRRLLRAGRPGGLTATDFIGMKGWFGILGAGVGIVALTFAMPRSINNISMMSTFATLCFFLPDFWLSRRIGRRQQAITRELPDILDMLVAAMESGLSFDNALVEVTSRWRTVLALEFLRVQRDMGIGIPRRQALIDLADRTGVPDVEVFVSVINQAEEMGVSIARTLAVQAEEMRIKRRQQAQEQANKAPIKILFPMVFLIFPALFAVLLGPAVPELLRAFSAL